MLNPRVRAFFVGGLLLLLLPVSMSYAQRFQPFGPLDFTQDWQPFAPAEISSYGGGIEPNTGFFFSYDRIHLWVNRPKTAVQPGKLDRTTGTRIDFGYMSKTNNGWIGEFMRINGPNVYDEPTDRQRDVLTLNPSGIDPTGGGPIIDVPSVTTQPYPNGKAENVGSLTSFEFSKLWRFKPLHGQGKGGSHVEMFLGGRFTTIKAQDSFNYNAGNAQLNAIFGPGPFPPAGLEPDFDPTTVAGLTSAQRYTPLGIMAENSIFGPQVGLRWFRQRGRWTISAEGRGFFAVNRQQITGGYPIQEAIPVQAPAPPTAGSTLGFPLSQANPTVISGPTTVASVPESRTVQTYNVNQWKWAPAGDVRFNANWEITKSFALEAGWEWLYFANGIARGKSDGPGNPYSGLDNQDMMFTGWTVGFVVNR
ncbi:MAG: hypothetical protein CBB70_10650 [Planctomycetaceae bacterium TMED10]|nr:MAG: hypothetical protein CBB70_10650 [Planctomycetaceae bacterium TMED10]